MPRRTHTYLGDMGWNEWNAWSTVGAMILGLGIASTIIQIIHTCIKGEKCGDDPWDARTLEWATSSPPKDYNFARIPEINARDQVWADKYGKPEEKSGLGQPEAHGIHMPDRSWYPLSASFGLFMVGLGMVFHKRNFLGWDHTLEMAIIGGVIILASIYAWAFEGPRGYHLHPEKD
jgi:cytochrome c oxidase subunit 1